MAALYHSLFTEQGLALLRESIQNGTKLGITHMSFGDGGGNLPIPDASFTQMINEVYRVQLNRLAPSKENPNWLEADGVIPSAVGGFNIREVGLWAGDVMVAYANYPPTYKPSGDQGTAQIKTIRIVLQIDNTANFELKIDASVVMATIQAIEDVKNELYRNTIKHVKSIDELFEVEKWDQRTVYVESVGLFRYDETQSNNNNGGTVQDGWILDETRIFKTSWWGLPKSEFCFSDFEKMVTVLKPIGGKILVDKPGVYDLGDNYFPVGNRNTINSSLRLEDYNNLTIECVEGVVFKTSAVKGRDVFQLNAVKNFHLLGFPKITSSITDFSGSGSNAVSITNGGENLTIHVDITDLPYTVKTDHIDGGKGVTIQTGSLTSNPTRNIEINLRNASNCSYGFNADITSSQIQNNPISNIKVRGFVENAYRAVSIALDQTAVSLGANGLNVGIDIDMVTKNCQQHYIEQRAWNLKAKLYVINTLQASSLRKNDILYDTEVFVSSILGKKYGSAEISGSVLDVNVLHRLGGTGNNGGSISACSFADINYNVNFNTATKELDVINFGGNIVSSCNLQLKNINNLSELLFYYPNNITKNAVKIYRDIKVEGEFQLNNTSAEKKFKIRTDGHLEVPKTSTAPVGTESVGKMAVYNLDGTLWGYVPVFKT
ncbi:phage tail protein [Acinetobacter baumannii]|uniref:phage tail protein n=1 Tax=Acinetobacter baumannii TaxID=470 RepID=UPI001D17A90C|nr:phage tail protein [Acinetobacter baumannii]